jgi:hypothetical protein
MLVFVVAKKVRDEFRMSDGAALRAGCAIAGAKALSPFHRWFGPAKAVPLLQSHSLFRCCFVLAKVVSSLESVFLTPLPDAYAVESS